MNHSAEELCKKIKSMRLQGRFSEGEEYLKEGEGLYPDSVMLSNEGYHLYSMKGDWNRALEYASKLSSLEPEKGKHSIKKGRVWIYLDNHKKAEKCFAIGIYRLSGKTVEALEAEVEKNLLNHLGLDSTTPIESIYSISGGKNNLGFFHHRLPGDAREYITKILEKRKKREAYFYQQVLEELPELKAFCPSFVCTDLIGEIRFLTIEKVIPEKTTKEEKNNQIKYFFLQTGKIAYSEELRDFLKVPKSPLRLGEGRSQGLVKYFERIHRKEENELIFKQIREKLRRKEYPFSVKFMFNTWERMVIKSGIYLSIHPEEDYALIHGDLGPHNLLYQKNSVQVKVIDWNSFRMGPRTYDLANFAVKSKQDLPGMEKELTTMDKFLLYYAMSTIAFMGSGKKKYRKEHLSNASIWLKKGKNFGKKIMKERGMHGKALGFSFFYGLSMGAVKGSMALEHVKGALLWVRRKNRIN